MTLPEMFRNLTGVLLPNRVVEAGGCPSHERSPMGASPGTRAFALGALCLLSVLTSANEILFHSQRARIVGPLSQLWSLVFGALLASWAVADAQSRSCRRSFDFPYFICMCWPLSLPYYLVATRGIRGLGQFVGFVLVYAAPFLAAYVAFQRSTTR